MARTGPGRLTALAAGLLLTGSAEAACVITEAAQLPITMDGLRPMLHVKMEGRDERLLLDSGAFYSTLSSAEAAALKVRPRDAAGVWIEGVGGGFVAKAGYVKSITFGKVTMSNVGFLIGGSEVGAAGLLGQDLLHAYDVEYDFAQGLVRLLSPKDCAGQNLAYWAGGGYAMVETAPTTQLQPHTVGTVQVNGVKLRAMFDTGASSTILSTAAAARAGVRPGGPGVVEAGFSSGIGRGTVRSWIGSFASVRIGQEEIKQVRLRFTDLGDDTDMLIGADFFLSHRVLISNSQHKLYFTYAGGPVFNLANDSEGEGGATVATAAAPAVAAPALGSAAEYARRGAASVSRQDLRGALADLDQAVAKEPGNPGYLAQRATLHRQMHHDDLALADLDRAVALGPNAGVLIARARLRLARDDRAGAVADTDHAAAGLPEQSDLRLTIADLYEGGDAFGPAVEQYGTWLKAHPNDSKRAQALNGRCWARALAGHDLTAALADCNAALYLAPKSADILDSRGLVRLRAGDLDRALADYNAALAAEHDIPWSLYGRGLIERKRGDAAKGDADIAAALKLDKEVAVRADRYGIRP